MGISVISSYRGGCNFEAVGLSRAIVADYFPGMSSRISGIGIVGIEKKIKEVNYKDKKYLGILLENKHDLEKYEWQKPHQPNQTGTENAYHPNKNNEQIKKKYTSWKS